MFVKKKSVKPTHLRLTSDPPPSFVRFQKICTFADVGIYPQRNPTESGMINFFSIMSKGNMLLGHARGKVGSLVFSRANGKQIVRSRAEVVKNPRTEQQMVQRIILNTVAQAYSQMKAITDHSFQGLSEGQACMSYFMQRNLNALRTKVAAERAKGATFEEIYEFSPLKSNFLAINDYEIAKGTLPEVSVISNNADATMAINLAENTYEGVCNKFGLKRGDQLTFVAIISQATNKREFAFARVILDPRESDGKEAAMNTEFASNGAINKPSDRNEGSFATLTFSTDKLAFGFGSKTAYQIGAAVIVSRRSADGLWLRSNAKITQNDAGGDLTYTKQDYLTLLQDSSLDTLSDMYLNNAGTGNIPTGKPSSGGGTGGGPSTEG